MELLTLLEAEEDVVTAQTLALRPLLQSLTEWSNQPRTYFEDDHTFSVKLTVKLHCPTLETLLQNQILQPEELLLATMGAGPNETTMRFFQNPTLESAVAASFRCTIDRIQSLVFVLDNMDLEPVHETAAHARAAVIEVKQRLLALKKYYLDYFDDFKRRPDRYARLDDKPVFMAGADLPTYYRISGSKGQQAVGYSSFGVRKKEFDGAHMVVTIGQRPNRLFLKHVEGNMFDLSDDDKPLHEFATYSLARHLFGDLNELCTASKNCAPSQGQGQGQDQVSNHHQQQQQQQQQPQQPQQQQQRPKPLPCYLAPASTTLVLRNVHVLPMHDQLDTNIENLRREIGKYSTQDPLKALEQNPALRRRINQEVRPYEFFVMVSYEVDGDPFESVLGLKDGAPVPSAATATASDGVTQAPAAAAAADADADADAAAAPPPLFSFSVPLDTSNFSAESAAALSVMAIITRYTCVRVCVFVLVWLCFCVVVFQ